MPDIEEENEDFEYDYRPARPTYIGAPKLAPVFWISAFFGPLGFFPADRGSRQAAMLGLPRERYWITWILVWATIFPVIWTLVMGVFFTSLFSAILPDFPWND